eukprot:gene14792-16327_t
MAKEEEFQSLQLFASSNELEHFIDDISSKNFHELLMKHDNILELFNRYENHLSDHTAAGPMATFWQSFLEMINILFCFIRSLRIGDWHLHLESTRKMLPWMFAYDCPNYSRHLTYYWAEMQKLPEKHPSIYEEFRNGNFSTRRQPGFFNAIASDQVIEQTINREQKCQRGITGYSTTSGTVQRWVLTSHCAAKALGKLESMVYINDSPSTTKDLGASRVAFDEAAVCRVYDIFSTWGNPFEFNESLFNIASGLVASPDVSRDLLNAGSCGEAALQRFFKERVNSGEKPFYDAIPRCNLKSFAALKVKKLCKLKEKSITINAERGIFANLLVIREKRETTSMRDLLSFSLGPIPWSLALPDGGLVKTVKSKLLSGLESDVPSLEMLPDDTVYVYDGMVLLQQLDAIHLDTVSKGQSKSIFLVTDQYLPNSVEEMERNRRTAGGAIKFTLNRREQKRPKQFKKYLSDPCNKIQLVKFLIADWSNSDRFKSKIGNRCIYVTVEDKCYAIYVEEEEVRCTEAEELFSNQEEADTKTFFAANTLNYWDMETYALIGSKNLTHVLDIKAIYDNIGPSVASSLPALHAFTGCDYTSAFHGIGKVKALKVLKKDERFQYVFGVIGDDFEFDGDLFEIIQEFVCTLYGLKSLSDVNEARYKKFCSSKRKIPEPQQLPPTSDELLQHCKRVLYVAGIVKRAFEPNPEVPSLHGFGWKINSDALEIEWMTKSPAPDSILELVSCNCKKAKCAMQNCVCVSHGLKCTDMCGCTNCNNDLEEEDDDVSDSEDDAAEEHNDEDCESSEGPED